MNPIAIKIAQNGPYIISAQDAMSLLLVDHEGNAVALPEGKVVKLCRCGASTKKPFCDGTHSKIGFQGATAAAKVADELLSQADGGRSE